MVRILITLLVFGLLTDARSQTRARGEVSDLATGAKIKFASVRNLNNGEYTVADSSGYFSIPAARGDRLEVHALSYVNDTVEVTNERILYAFLQRMTNVLNEVRILRMKPLDLPVSAFHGQSMVYKRDYDEKEIGGVVFRIWYWKKDEKRRQKKEETIRNYEYLTKVRSEFTDENVARYVPLKGEDLNAFVKAYSPSAEDVFRGDFNLVIYINECYKRFKETKNKK